MFYNAKEFLEQDLTYKGPMRRRYNELLEIYKGYNIYRYNRGEWERVGAEKIDDDLIVEADTIEEVKQWLDENIKKQEANYVYERKFYVCACEDFTTESTKLIEFEKLENASLDSEGEKKDLSDIKHIIELNTYNIDKTSFKNFFWEMFIVDCLIGNTDRHNGNFGFIKNIKTEELTIAPIYDCGSCLFSTYTDEKMEEVLNNNGALRDCIKNTSSAIKYKGSKIKYNDFITKQENNDCIEALIRIYPKIEIKKINNIIDEIPCITEIRKEFYKTIIKEKYEKILKFAYNKIITQKQKK